VDAEEVVECAYCPADDEDGVLGRPGMVPGAMYIDARGSCEYDDLVVGERTLEETLGGCESGPPRDDLWGRVDVEACVRKRGAVFGVVDGGLPKANAEGGLIPDTLLLTLRLRGEGIGPGVVTERGVLRYGLGVVMDRGLKL